LFLRSFPCPQHSRLIRFLWEPRVEIPKNAQNAGENHTKKPSNTKAWTSDQDERIRKLIISNASVIDIAADLGRAVKAVRARAHTPTDLARPLAVSGKNKGKMTASCPQGGQ
jgi:hypothetical protein